MRVLLSGANRGIGLQLATQLSSREGVELHCLQRTRSEDLDKLPLTIHDGYDFSQDDFLEKSDDLEGEFDLAILNAGIGFNNEEELQLEKLSQQFMVNAISQVALVHRMRKKFRDGAKIVFISSIMGSTQDNTGGYYGYRASKAALNNLAVTLSKEFSSLGITVLLFHPGYVQTDMTNGMGNITTAQSAQNILEDIQKFDLSHTGLYWHTEDKVEIPY